MMFIDYPFVVICRQLDRLQNMPAYRSYFTNIRMKIDWALI